MTGRRFRLFFVALLAGSLGVNSSGLGQGLAQAPPEPDGYRMEDYRAPTPATLSGAHVIDTEQAHGLWRARSAAFIDVLPRAPKPANLPPGTVWRDKPRSDIPGSLWLPDTGYGVLAEPTLAYFKRGLENATAGDRSRALLFYCLTNCWMSWNAAKRALALGYSNVFWYPDGTDGWEAAAYELEPREPAPRD